jgi:hypothetical protein
MLLVFSFRFWIVSGVVARHAMGWGARIMRHVQRWWQNESDFLRLSIYTTEPIQEGMNLLKDQREGHAGLFIDLNNETNPVNNPPLAFPSSALYRCLVFPSASLPWLARQFPPAFLFLSVYAWRASRVSLLCCNTFFPSWSPCLLRNIPSLDRLLPRPATRTRQLHLPRHLFQRLPLPQQMSAWISPSLLRCSGQLAGSLASRLAFHRATAVRNLQGDCSSRPL